MHATLRRISLNVAFVIAVVGAAACTGFAAKGEAETGVASFHGMLDAEQYADIYSGTDDLFKNATSETQFTEILKAVHRKLGVVVSTAQTSVYSRDQAGTNAGSYISLTYKTEFAEGPATESFNWRVVDGKVHLAGYNIQSSLLITR
ncbi:MAG: DUF4019 domain-containing protein [Chloroflexi bacterium]|nr:MAG: DUF4019 domain-containing protein [Chloroflexota bacterium]TMF61235.1 MAG: DUF4019 domain-containing protein [Chloroflexota bacterium]TMG62855.1 MAG: DUF4019 domain-containing protein [Chloroflexota bacterium]